MRFGNIIRPLSLGAGGPTWNEAPITTMRLGQALSSTSSSSATDLTLDNDAFLSSSGVAVAAAATRQVPVPVPSEPNLYHLPNGVSPIYRRVPVTVQAAVLLVSAAIAAATWFRPPRQQQQQQQLVDATIRSILASSVSTMQQFWWWRRILWFCIQTVLVAALATFALQDVFWGPSRVTIQQLLQEYFLPSKFSKYEQIPLEIPESSSSTSEASATTTTLGVHFLKHVVTGNKNNKNNPHLSSSSSLFQALYVNHGFGASSLSWLPALAPLQDGLGIPIALGHDACGFGFTERKRKNDDNNNNNNIRLYTSKASAALGLAILKSHAHLGEINNSTNYGAPLLLMGHSMGATTTLRMALALKNVPKQVILVAPALGVRSQTKEVVHHEMTASNTSRWQRAISQCLRRIARWMSPRSLLDATAGYVLRRVVGTRNFWRKGLRLAWGDPKRLSDSDVLRFQWPSIGEGWERGLLTFTRAQFLPTDLTDHELMENVLRLPNTNVSVIVGTKDKIVNPDQVRQFLKDFPSIPLVELDGLGHDPFEEDTESFVQAVKNCTVGDHGTV